MSFAQKEVGREAASITIFCQFFLSDSAEKFRRGTILCFRKFVVGKNILCLRRDVAAHLRGIWQTPSTKKDPNAQGKTQTLILLTNQALN